MLKRGEMLFIMLMGARLNTTHPGKIRVQLCLPVSNIKGAKMSRERYRFGAVLVGLIFQIVGGVLAFGFAPQAVFTDIGSEPLAQVCIRLAVYSNASMALVVALVLRFAPEPRWLRWIAAGGALYHLLAGLDGLRTALGFAEVNLAEPVLGPAIFHGVMLLILLPAALLAERKALKVGMA